MRPLFSALLLTTPAATAYKRQQGVRRGRWRYAARMSNAHPPRRRGHAGRTADARVVEVETITGHCAGPEERGGRRTPMIELGSFALKM